MRNTTEPLSAASGQQPTYLLQVQVPRATSTRDITALETAMHGLALDDAHPVALELAATATTRSFLLRATTAVTLQHLAAQIRARYPQAEIAPLPADEDPLQLQAAETVSALELQPGAATYLPLRAWKERELLKEGTDPLLGILAAFHALPPQMRVVTQLALLPLPASWSQGARRRTVEHPLEGERLRQRQEMSRGQAAVPGTAQLVGLGCLVALLLLWWRFSPWLKGLLPPWLLQAGVQLLLHGQMPQLTAAHVTALLTGGALLLAVLLLALWLFLQLQRRLGQTSIYDMRLVDEKTARLAYRVRLRLYVMGPDEGRGCGQPSPVSQLPALFPFARWLLATWPAPQKLSLPYLIKTLYQQWRREAARRRLQRQVRTDILNALAAAYKQYHTAAGGYFVPQRVAHKKAQRLLTTTTPQRRGLLRARLSGWAYDLRQSRHLLSVADLAALWHLPQAQDLADLPFVARGRARTFLVPGALSSGNGWNIGVSEHAGQSLPVYLPAECLHHNLLSIASTGKGKSTLFQHLVQAAVSCRETATDGLVVIEPHGDLVHSLLGLLPHARRDEVVVVDLANRAFPVGINPLDVTLGRDRDKAVDNLLTIFEQIWSNSYGPRTENILEYGLKTLVDANESLVRTDLQHGPDRQYTLLDLVPLLRRTSFRHAVLEQVSDTLLLDWWQAYYEPLDLRLQTEITSSVITKVSKFASSRVARHILGQPRSSLNLSEIVAQGQILLVSTASGVVGADISALIGAVLLGYLQATLAEQARFQVEQRRRFLVLIDEFQVFRGVNYQGMLAELRKYGGSFGLATQSLSYLDAFDRTLRPTVLANVDALFAFDMAAEDARHLYELDGIDEHDITNLDDFQCYTRLSLGGRRLPIFSLRLHAPPSPDQALSEHIRLRSQQRDARPVGLVDDLLRKAQVRQQYASPAKKQAAENPAQNKGETRPPMTQGPPAAAKEQASSTTPPGAAPRNTKHDNGSRQEATPAHTTTSTQRHVMYQDEQDGAEREGGGGENDAATTD